MAKAKLKISVNEVEKLKLAAELEEVTLGEGKEIGNKVVLEVSCRNPSQLFALGRAIETITED